MARFAHFLATSQLVFVTQRSVDSTGMYRLAIGILGSFAVYIRQHQKCLVKQTVNNSIIRQS